MTALSYSHDICVILREKWNTKEKQYIVTTLLIFDIGLKSYIRKLILFNFMAIEIVLSKLSNLSIGNQPTRYLELSELWNPGKSAPP